MSYRYLFTILGVVLVACGWAERGWFLLAVWLGIDFLLLGLAYARGMHRIFGKKRDGTLSLWGWLVFFPLLASGIVVWRLVQMLSREPSQNAVTQNLVVGRRLLPREVVGQFDNYLDLTAEFSEPRAIRRDPSYRSLAILDGAAPSPEALFAVVESLRPGRTFIHCAQGHGRTGLVALAVLLRSGMASSVEDGLRRLQNARPGICLSREQLQCIRAYARRLANPAEGSPQKDRPPS